jgi:hypothetical protein
MNYEYKWVHPYNIKNYKKKLIPLKAIPFMCNHMPVINKGKYKGCIGIEGLVLCIVKK